MKMIRSLFLFLCVLTLVGCGHPWMHGGAKYHSEFRSADCNSTVDIESGRTLKKGVIVYDPKTGKIKVELEDMQQGTSLLERSLGVIETLAGKVGTAKMVAP